jgi:hypothetical protein
VFNPAQRSKKSYFEGSSLGPTIPRGPSAAQSTSCTIFHTVGVDRMICASRCVASVLGSSVLYKQNVAQTCTHNVKEAPPHRSPARARTAHTDAGPVCLFPSGSPVSDAPVSYPGITFTRTSAHHFSLVTTTPAQRDRRRRLYVCSRWCTSPAQVACSERKAIYVSIGPHFAATARNPHAHTIYLSIHRFARLVDYVL